MQKVKQFLRLYIRSKLVSLALVGTAHATILTHLTK
jgi:hypothetical protein